MNATVFALKENGQKRWQETHSEEGIEIEPNVVVALIDGQTLGDTTTRVGKDPFPADHRETGSRGSESV